MAGNGATSGFKGEFLRADVIRQLLAACNQGPTGIRNRAFLALLWRGGLRTAEALGLQVADLDPERGVVHVRSEIAKGGRPRWIGLDPEAFAYLDLWFDRRRTLGLGAKRRVFVTLQGEPVSDRYCRAMIKRAAEKAGIHQRVHLHALRHSHASELLAEGAPINEVQAQLGHRNLATTSLYVDHVTADDLAARARGRPSWAGATSGAVADA